MDSLVNYESDDGESKITNKNRSRGRHDKHSPEPKKRHAERSGGRRERKQSTSDDDSSSDSDNSIPHSNGNNARNDLSEDNSDRHSSSSPRKVSSTKDKSHHKKAEKRRRRSSSRDDEKYERKRRHDDRGEKRKHRRSSRDRRSESRGRDERRNKERERHRSRSNERKSDKYGDRKKYDRRTSDRRSDDRRSNKHEADRREDRHDRRDERDDRRRSDTVKFHSDREANDKHGHSSYFDSKQVGKGSSQSRPNSNDDNSRSKPLPNSTIAMRQAEALSRTLERRAQEKVQQLQKLGIEIPTMMQQQQQIILENQLQNSQIKPLMSINTSNVASQPTAMNLMPDQSQNDSNLTLNLTNFTSPVLTNARYTEQMQKKKLIWGAKKAECSANNETTTNNKWETAKFSQDNDGKVASKFLRLMGMKNVPATASSTTGETSNDSAEEIDPTVKRREQMFSSMEHQYEVARQATHTMRGMGLGFGSHSRPC